MGGEQGGFLRRIACQVLPLTRLGEGAQASDAPVDKFRDWQENTNSIFWAAEKLLRQQMEVWFYLGTTAERPNTRGEEIKKNLHSRSSEARRAADVDIAYQFLKTQPGVSREFIGAGGASCGVHQAVMFAQRHPEVKSLVLLSETTSRVGRQFIRRAPQLPLLMAAADDDDDTGVVEAMQWMADISPNPSTRLIHYSVGGHGVDMFIAHPDLPDTIVSWFSTTLKSSAASATPRTAKPQTKQAAFLDLMDEPGGVSKATQMYADEHKRDPNAALLSEVLLNRLGYEHLTTGDPQGAIQIFQLNATAFPNSPNVYDSLSDAYLATDQKDLARQNATKALELLKSDTTDPPERRKAIQDSAEQKLKQLGGTQP